jgi:hypothetical protein
MRAILANVEIPGALAAIPGLPSNFFLDPHSHADGRVQELRLGPAGVRNYYNFQLSNTNHLSHIINRGIYSQRQTGQQQIYRNLPALLRIERFIPLYSEPELLGSVGC